MPCSSSSPPHRIERAPLAAWRTAAISREKRIPIVSELLLNSWSITNGRNHQCAWHAD